MTTKRKTDKATHWLNEGVTSLCNYVSAWENAKAGLIKIYTRIQDIVFCQRNAREKI